MNLDEYNDMDSLMIEGSDSAVNNDDVNNLEEGTIMDDMDDFKLPEDDSKTETDDFPSLDDDMKLDDDLNLDTDLNLDDDLNCDEPTLADTSDTSDTTEETDTNFDFDDKTFEEEKPQSSYSSPLYDEDTFDETAKDKKKKVLIPVVICGVVVVLALAALLVYLFAIKPKAQAKPAESVKVEVVENESSDAAREDEIVIVETPVVEPVNKNSEKSSSSEVINYKIKWGDTLWDISKTYYKTPWQYQFLADYNNIQNPDLIIAGKNLDIPPK
ncbi:MAG: LysM peptidoglycan-binding domain-containing protein [Treponemataceae bacterium]|nr:LysM peptidoglycan-binding domain-containing protein [Treponemataceae bacterium]